jgi:hypothetical protein
MLKQSKGRILPGSYDLCGIEKEDKHFFFPTQEYFSKDEQDAVLLEFEDFNAKMIHEKYSRVVERLERA